MCGSSPLAEAVTKSTGTGVLLSGSAARNASTRDFTASASAGFVRPRFDPLDEPALYGIGDVADGRLQKYFGSLNACPINALPMILPSRSIRLSSAARFIATCAIAVTRKG